MGISSSDMIAAGALIISVLSLAFSIESRLRDKYRLRFHSFMQVTIGGGPDQFHIGVVVTNEGRRPISLVEIYFEEDAKELGSEKYPIRTPIHGGFPNSLVAVELAENQTRQFMSKPLSRKDLLKKTKAFKVGVVDSKGKHYVTNLENEAYYSDEEEET